MRIPLWTIILHAVPYNGAPLSSRSNSVQICLPVQLQAAVPSCALECLQVFIANNYHNHECSVTANLNLLCATGTVSGLTIGEGALQCVVSDCPNANLDTQSGYTVCQGVPGAQPNMAETITATISAFTTVTPTGDMSLSVTNTDTGTIVSESSISSPTNGAVSTVQSASISPNPSPSPASASSSISTIITESALSTLVPMSSLLSSSSVSTTSSVTTLTSASSTFQAPTTASVDHTSSASTSSATAAAATEAPIRKQFSPSAVAGIATACVIVVGLLIGYLAYACYVKRREKDRRRSQRFSSFFPPLADHDRSEPPTDPTLTGSTQMGSLSSAPNKRFYSAENDNQKRQSFWRRSFLPHSSEIGVAIAASTRVLPEHPEPMSRSKAQGKTLTSPVPLSLQAAHGGSHQTGQNRWSVVSSLNEDLEAHNQELPVLASPRTRSSSRSFSSAGIEKPPPLKLNTMSRAAKPTTERIPLTPTYDNGNYEPTIQQVLERPAALPVIVRPSREQKMNFSMRQPSVISRSAAAPRQPASQVQKRGREVEFPSRPINPGRKESTVTNTTTSIYTEFEEDSTPEEDEDKQLHNLPQRAGISRPPLRDLQWPQVPRPAATSKQAEKTPSPRPVPTIRAIPPSNDVLQTQSQTQTSNNRMGNNDRSFMRFTVSSTETDSGNNSISPVFPTPPPRNPLRLSSQPWLTRQISDAYTSATCPTTATTPTKFLRPPVRQYTQQGQRPAPQRLRTGRPLAHKIESQGYIPRSQVYEPALQQGRRPAMVRRNGTEMFI